MPQVLWKDKKILMSRCSLKVEIQSYILWRKKNEIVVTAVEKNISELICDTEIRIVNQNLMGT